jgi:hypothetical protein
MTRSNTAFVACPCNICKGESVKQSVAIKHKRDADQAERRAARRLGSPIATLPAESKSDGAIDGLVDDVFRWTLGGRTSNAQWKQGDAIWERDGEEDLFEPSSPPVAHAYSAPTPPPASSAPRNKGTPGTPLTCGERKKTLYDELALLDNKLESRIDNIAYILGAEPPMPSTDPLKDHEVWLRSTLQTLRATKSGEDLATKTLLAAMLARVEDHILKIEAHTRIAVGEGIGREAEEFDTGAR